MIQETHLDQEPGAFTKGRDTQESTQRGTYEQEKPRSNDVRKGEKHRFGWEQTLLILLRPIPRGSLFESQKKTMEGRSSADPYPQPDLAPAAAC